LKSVILFGREHQCGREHLGIKLACKTVLLYGKLL